MNLKEAFRYQNFLDTMLNGAIAYLSVPQNIIEYTHIHHKHHVNPDVEDEVETHEQLYPSAQLYVIDEIVDFTMAVMQEKENLSLAVTRAKQFSGFAVDHEIAINKTRQLLARAMNALARIKTTTRTTKGTGFRFNVEGNQVSYIYDVEEDQRLRYEPAGIKQLARDLLSKADLVSSDAEKFMVDTLVDFDPAFDVNDTFDEAFQAYSAARHNEE